MTSTAAENLWAAMHEPVWKHVDEHLDKVKEKADVDVNIFVLDSASSNRRFLAFLWHLWRQVKTKRVMWWCWCMTHLTHAEQGTVLRWLHGGMELIMVVYSTTLLLRTGSYWVRLTETVRVVVDANLEIRRGSPPEVAGTIQEVILEICQVAHAGLGEEAVVWPRFFATICEVLNGIWFERRFVHYCTGETCCANGRATTLDRIETAIKQGLMNARPALPVLSRWSKVFQSLAFWLPALAIHRVVLMCFALFFQDAAQKPVSTSEKEQAMHGEFGELDPEFVKEVNSAWNALNGKRIKKAFKGLPDPCTLQRFLVCSMVLTGLQYINAFLNASVRSVRIKARLKNKRARPPVLDLVNVRFSFVVACSNITAASSVNAAMETTPGISKSCVFCVTTNVRSKGGRLKI